MSNRGTDGMVVPTFHLPTTVQRTGVPVQSWHATHVQWGEGRCDGFVTSAQAVAGRRGAAARSYAAEAAAAAMGYWCEDDLPFYYGLARTFPLADHWFSSCLGPTFPNRRFLIAGTAHGLIDDSPYDLLDYPPAGTIFDVLTRYGISWANYHPVRTIESRWKYYRRHRRKMARRRMMSVARSVPAVTRGVQKDITFTGRPLPARDGPVHAACPQHRPVLRRRRQRDAAGLLHRGPGL